jgi:hypothetical protein
MEFEDALAKLLDGTAIMFAGAGCSDRAINLRGRPFLKGSELAKHFAERAGITDTILSLDDAAEAFVEKHGDNALIREIQNEFTAKSITDYHIQLGNLPWRLIYTTNFDDVLEEAYKKNSKVLIPVTTSDDPFSLSKGQTLCVHLNGFIHRLNLDTIGTELKLTESSYLSLEFADSPWATAFRYDINIARAVFFIGYSLYDLDLKRILFDNPALREKCFFILGKSVDDSTLRRAKQFGTVCEMSVGEFCNHVQQKRHTYIPAEKPEVTISIRELKPIHARTKITDRDFTNLLILGTRNERSMFESIYSNQPYLLERMKIKEAFELLEQGHRVITICSDLGNGKTLFLDGLRIRALERGFRVFEVREHSPEAALELDRIAGLEGNVLVTIEEYQDWLTEIGQFRRMSSGNGRLVLTARSPVHDVHIDALERETGLEHIPEIYLDTLEGVEVDWFIDSLDKYGLWGEWAARPRAAKSRLIRIVCRGQIHALLLQIMDSPDIGRRLRELAEALSSNREKYEVLIGICILTLLNQMPTFDTLVEMFGPGTLSKTRFRRDPLVSNFLDFSQNEILLKSPIAAQYVLKEIADPAFVVSVLTKLVKRADTVAFMSRRYQKMLSNLMMFSSLQFVLPQDGRASAVMSYYESIKDLRHCRESPLFWLQYAIACLVIEDLDRSGRYFETSYSFAYKQSFNTYQIDNHYARFLLVQAIRRLEAEPAMENFRRARTIINQQVCQERMHYPYRVATHYQEFLDRFSSSLTPSQLQELGKAAEDVSQTIDGLPYQRSKHKYIIECRKAMHYVVDKVKELQLSNEKQK